MLQALALAGSDAESFWQQAAAVNGLSQQKHLHGLLT